MGEIKSVKVDNWGVFFLQKLQNFFNKTDYCDMTLQFRDNSQLKVHRLVMNACTDYFNMLENTCEIVDDAIIMPNELQADVVVPIVNFMYTGTLEFELKMYNRLLRTARDMNMTVLLKLLEAHRRTMEIHPQRNQVPLSPKSRRRGGISNMSNISRNTPSVTNSGKIAIGNQSITRRVISTGTGNNNMSENTVAGGGSSNVSTKIILGTNSTGSIQQSNMGHVTFTRVPKVEHNQQQQQTISTASTSPFEQLRKSYNNNKRPATATYISPPAKKPNLEDVKEFAEQQRMRKQIAAEYGDDGDYDGGLMDEDNLRNDDDDDEMINPAMSSTSTAGGQQQFRQQRAVAGTTSTAGVQTNLAGKQGSDTTSTSTITIRQDGPDKSPTIIVKDTANSKLNHAKIISEVLRQYPHLIKGNRNIKVKVMPNSAGGTGGQKIIIKKEIPVETAKGSQQQLSSSLLATRGIPPSISVSKVIPSTSGNVKIDRQVITNQGNALQKGTVVGGVISNQQQQQITTSVSRPQTMSNTGQVTDNLSSGPRSALPTSGTDKPQQKRRIDSKTMHNLIALGAENTTGPWLCLKCGRNGHPISIPSYRSFRRHLINTHKDYVDPALCEYCGWRSSNKRELHFHMQVEHKARSNLYIFPECQLCNQMCIDSDGLNNHLIESHPEENKQQCIYCNKIFADEMQLYTHMRTYHKKQALEDGIIDYSDEEIVQEFYEQEEQQQNQQQLTSESQQQQEQINVSEKVTATSSPEKKKIKILSDISLPKTDTPITDLGRHASNASSVLNITNESNNSQTNEYVGEENETKFVCADGSEMILTEEQRKEILAQLNQEHEGGIVMVLNESHLEQAVGVVSTDDGNLQQVLGVTTIGGQGENLDQDDAERDDSQIYNEMKSECMDEMMEEETAASQNAAVDDNEGLGESVTETDAANITAENSLEVNDLTRDTQQMDESKESIDNLEWAENLISEHEMASENEANLAASLNANSKKVHDEKEKKEQLIMESAETKNNSNEGETTVSSNNESNLSDEQKKNAQDDVTKLPVASTSKEELSRKLKELTGDWSDDDEEAAQEIEDEDMEESAEVQEREVVTDEEDGAGDEDEAGNLSNLEEDNTNEGESDILKKLDETAELKKNLEGNEDNDNEASALKDILSDFSSKNDNDAIASGGDKQETSSSIKTEANVEQEKNSSFKEDIKMEDNIANPAYEMDIDSIKKENDEIADDDDDDIGLALKSLHKDVAEEITKVCKIATISSRSNSPTATCTSAATGSCSAIQTVENVDIKLEKSIEGKTSSALAEMIDKDQGNEKRNLVSKDYSKVSMTINKEPLEHQHQQPSSSDEMSLKKELLSNAKEEKNDFEQKKSTSESGKLQATLVKETTISSEERVKNLISEWGDDDDEEDEVGEEDEEDNDEVEAEEDVGGQDGDDGSDDDL